MTHGVNHEFWVEAGNSPALKMANDDDPYYIQTFSSWEDVERFIEKMRAEAEKAFGPNPR